MNIDISVLKSGFSIKAKDKEYKFLYPGSIWQALRGNLAKVISHNLAYLNTYYYPLMFDKAEEIKYNIPYPFLSQYFFKNIIYEIVLNCDEYDLNAKKYLIKMINAKQEFSTLKSILPKVGLAPFKEKAVISMSFGKDSLTSYALAEEIGLEPEIVYFKDTLGSKENEAKLELCKKFAKEFDKRVYTVTNELEYLRDSSDEDFGSNSLLATYTIGLIPFNVALRAKYVVLGNEKSLNDYYYGKEKFVCYPSFDQTSESTATNRIYTKLLTNGRVGVLSLIEPIHDIMIFNLLFNRYPKLSKYIFSCGGEYKYSGEDRWCHDCAMCCKAYLFLLAVGVDPKKGGLNKDMLKKRFKKYFPIFNSKPERCYERTKGARDEILFAFYLAYKKGAKGELIDLFKKKFLKEAVRREKELKEEFLGFHATSNLNEEMNRKLRKIVEEGISLL